MVSATVPAPPKRLISAEALRARSASLFAAAGVPAAAEEVSAMLVDADLRGVHSHGCR